MLWNGRQSIAAVYCNYSKEWRKCKADTENEKEWNR
jgi:hypothetical protein